MDIKNKRSFTQVQINGICKVRGKKTTGAKAQAVLFKNTILPRKVPLPFKSHISLVTGRLTKASINTDKKCFK